MRITLTGINHQTATVAIREKVAISSRKLHDALLSMKFYSPRGVILSTCNRTEVYTAEPDSIDEKRSLNFFKSRLVIPTTELSRYVYLLNGRQAVEHLFRLASGLESMIVGEYEVLGQVGYALESAERAGMVHLPLRYIFQSAIRTGRRIREETGISRNAISVSSVAVELASRAVGDLRGCKMLVIGTGEAGRLVAKAAKERGISRTTVVGRTLERARDIAGQLGGTPASMDSLDDELQHSNIVISCSGAPHYTLNVGHIKRAMSRRPKLPMVIIDIAVPRNIEPAVGRINNIFLYNIDAITEISNENLKQREQEISNAEGIIAKELESFYLWWREFEVRPVIKAMMSKAEEIRRVHMENTLKKLPDLTEKEKHSLDLMTRAIISKILKDPIRSLKTNGKGDDNHSKMIKNLFQLEIKDY